MSNKRYIFIDAGCHKGQSIDNFKKCRVFQQYKWEIFGYEPHPQLYQLTVKKHPELKNTIYQKAVWIKNEPISFFEGADALGESHTVMTGKKTGNINYSKSLTVKAINISKWIKENFRDTDFVILKMDVEGAEYDILEQMKADDTLKLVKFLFIEWHAHKLKNFDMNRHINIVNFLKIAKPPLFVLHEKQLKRGENWFTCLDKNDNLLNFLKY